MLIAIGNDHAGYSLKTFVMDYLQSEGHSVLDCGSHSTESVDYPDIAKTVCGAFNEEKADFAILICGTGIGMSIAANKQRGILAALTNDLFSAKMAKEHNHANVICMGARILTQEQARDIIAEYMNSHKQAGNHDRRVKKLLAMDR